MLQILTEAGRPEMAASRAVDFLANRTFSLENLRFCDDGYWSVMKSGIAELMEYADEGDYSRRVDAQDKVVYAYVARGDLQGVRDFYSMGAAPRL